MRRLQSPWETMRLSSEARGERSAALPTEGQQPWGRAAAPHSGLWAGACMKEGRANLQREKEKPNRKEEKPQSFFLEMNRAYRLYHKIDGTLLLLDTIHYHG